MTGEEVALALADCFTGPTGERGLQALTVLANLEALSPVNMTGFEMADRTLWWKEGRRNLIDEVRSAINAGKSAKFAAAGTGFAASAASKSSIPDPDSRPNGFPWSSK